MRSLVLALTVLSGPALAHELWIAPTEYQISADTNLQAHLVNGELFEGVSLPFLPRNFDRFVVVEGGQFTNVSGRIGDSPAMNIEPLGEGLHVAAYVSNPSTLTYENWEKFQKFVDHKDLGDARTEHEARGLPLEGFGEVYIRYSKSLIAVGSGAGADRSLGMETEIVALTNPYLGEADDGMRLQLLYKREPRVDEQIEIFEKSPEGEVTVFLLRTDADGVATVPVKPGYAYMADAVVLREPSERLASDTGAVWETLWANLTWAQP